ncbi:outer membrane lipoprotein LolB [Aquabacterium sp.]|uniref:outer membrane lipoprotein LolB n=1 Tax=Aquabacterium sp. TaxID=1872578 RepID=UPI0035AE68C6
MKRSAARRLLAAAIALSLGAMLGCTTPPSRLPAEPQPGGVSLSGRINVRVEPGVGSVEPAQSVTAQFELEGRPDDGLLNLSTPLGTRMAQARWLGERAELIGPDGQRKSGHLVTLTREALGQSLPIGAMMSWLQGNPADNIASVPLPPPDRGFTQMGWVVNLNRWADRFIMASRDEPDRIEVRVKLDATADTLPASVPHPASDPR